MYGSHYEQNQVAAVHPESLGLWDGALRKFIMSRTDKTDPMWVQLATQNLASREFHNHCTTDCDLPSIWTPPSAWQRTKCSHDFVWTGTNVCACEMCSMRFERHLKRRRERRVARFDGRRWSYEFNGEGVIDEWY